MEVMSVITNIVMDFDNVIVNWDYWLQVKLLNVCKYAEHHLGYKNFHKTLWRLHKEKSIYYKWIFRDALRELGLDESIESHLYSYMVKSHVDDIVIDGFYKFLDWALTNDKVIYILTNGYEATHSSRIKALGLDNLMVKYCGGTKHPKPSGYWLNKWGLEPKNTIMIGDDTRDVIYPYYAGYHCIYFQPTAIDIPVDACYNYEEVKKYIEEIDNVLLKL